MASGKEKNGIEEIYEKYYKDVYRFVLALSKNPHIAEDITQEVATLWEDGQNLPNLNSEK